MVERVVPEPQRRRRRPTKQGTVLSEQVIVETALRLVGQHGADALTVRRLGGALGADPSALYRYFRNTDDLLLAVADELIGRSQRGWQPTGRWRFDLCELGLRIQASYRAHPQAALLAAHRTTGRDNERRAVEMILGVLRSAGFGDREAVRVYHAFVDQALAFATWTRQPSRCRPPRRRPISRCGRTATAGWTRTPTRTSSPPCACWTTR